MAQAPVCSDIELIVMALIGVCCGWGQVLITLGGLILDFELASANVTDLQVGCTYRMRLRQAAAW